MKLMATHISNLTDARYFAARMVDYMVFDPALLNVDAIPIIKEIQGWIDGVTWVLQGEEETEGLEFILSETGIDTGFSASSIFLQNFKRIFLIGDGEVRSPTGRFLIVQDALPSSEVLNDYLGLVVRGGHEEKVGYKSFEDLDRLFDILEKD